jgi:hypothetical protein
MNTIKKLLGIIWMLLGPALVIFMCWQAADKITLATAGVTKINTMLQWGIILLVFIPICAGLVLFGYYAFKGDYKILPEKSEDI